MDIKKILYYGLIVILTLNGVFALLFYVFTLLFPVPKNNTQNAVSISKPAPEISISKETSSAEPTTEPEIVPGPATEENNSLEDNFLGDVSVFEVPFSDGYEFPDLSAYDFVFIGDSIFDMNYSSTSMPRQLEVYTGARVYNLSKYGSCAGDVSNGYISISRIADVFLSGKATDQGENQSINIDVERFAADSHKGRKIVFVINQCINDYILATKISNPNDAMDINSYEGALRTSISKIKNAYPKATYVFMKPYFIGVSDTGNELNSYGYVMDDYIASMGNVAGEYGAMCFDLRSYDFFASYREGYLLDDLIHPNDMCSKTMARLFCDFVQCNIPVK